MNMHIAWAGNPYFAGPMERAGHRVTIMPWEQRMLSWPDVVARCGGQPDVFIYGDVSAPPFLRAVEAFPCLTVFYAVDTHIHSWYQRYAQAFDLCCVAMRDHLSGFLGHRLAADQVRWLPLFSKEHDRRIPGAPDFQVLFVGKNDALLTPGRFRLLSALAERVPLTVRQGRYPELYGRAKIVLNISEHGDLNFRVFEALGCGACLVTPRVGHGLLDIFSDGEELCTYDPDDMDGLVRLLETLLEDGDRRRRIADAGMKAVNAGHRASHRAADLLRWMQECDRDALVKARLDGREAILHEYLRLLYLHHAEAQTSPPLARMYLDFAGQGLAR